MKKKKTLLKITCTILLIIAFISMLLVARLLNETSFGADTTVIHINPEMQKYINYYLTDEDNGTLVQYEIKTQIEYGETKLLTDKSEIEITFGQIDGKYPKEVKVISENNFESNNQYDKDTGILVIQSTEQKDEKDNNYIAICYYDTYTEKAPERDLEAKIKAKTSFADEKIMRVSQEEQLKVKVAENIGKLTSVNNQSQEIYNGYMKSNKINKTNYTTEYDQIDQIMISKKEAQQALEIQENDVFISQEKNQEKSQEQSQEETVKEIELGNNNNIVYKTTKIQEKEIKEILGEEGKVEFIDEEGNVIDKIDKDTEFDESGIYTVNYENEPTKITIKTSEIKNEGYLNIRNTKQIKENAEIVENMGIKTIIQLNEIQYEKPEEVSEEALSKEEKEAEGKEAEVKETEKEENKEEKEIKQEVYEFKTEIKDATTKIDVNIDNTNWSNKEQNEVTFEIKLEANTIKDNMLKNPYIEIELPSQVEKVILGESNIVYANSLQLNEPSININKRGNKVIAVSLTGVQNEYYTNELDLSTNISIPATIILNKQMEESTEEEINVAYANQYTIDNNLEIGNKQLKVELENYQEIQQEQTETLYQKTRQILASNVDGLAVEVTPTKGETTLKNNDVVYEGEYIKYNIKITNTTKEDITNVKVVATIPEGVTYGELYTEFEQYRGKYKYNFNEETREKTIDVGVVQAGKTVTTYYEVKVNQLKEGEKTKVINTSIKTYIGEGLAKNYEITNTIEPSEVEMFLGTLIDYGGWSYNLNLSSKEDKEVTVKIHFPKYFKLESINYLNHILEDPSTFDATPEDHADTVYTNYEYSSPENQIRDLEVEISDDNVITAKLKTNSCYILMGQINKEDIEKPLNTSSVTLSSYAEAISEHTYFSNENRIEILYQKVNVTMTSPTEGEVLKADQEIEYDIKIENVGQNNVEGTGMPEYVSVDIVDYFPDAIEPEEITYDTWITEPIETPEDEEETQESDKILLKKQEGVTEDISGNYQDEDGNREPNLDINVILPQGESTTIKIKATVGAVEEEIIAENYAIIGGEELDTQTTNVISNIILPYDYDEPVEDPDDSDDQPIDPDAPDTPDTPDNPSNPSDPSNPETQKVYSISGLAWLDENENGRRDTEEKVLNGITAMLVDTKNATTIKESMETNEEGKYQFNNIEEGEYLILFKYDSNLYKITEYQKEGVNSNTNSDVTIKNVKLDGQTVTVGITNNIQLNQNVSNIDIGLINNKTCDFKIDKYVSNVTVKTKNGTKQYDFKNSNLAKVEIKGNEIEGANVTIKYTIVVTNVGESEGTVGKIVDYLPEGLNFSTDTSSGWVKNKNNQIVNESISNKTIKKGESVQLGLTVTKTMTGDSTGDFTNKVEIQEIKDKSNVTDNNTANNVSNAVVIISIKTGIIVYTSIAIAILVLLTLIAICLYKKGKINIKKINKITFIALLFFAMIFVKVYDVQAYWWEQSYYFDYDEVANVSKHRFSSTGLEGWAYCLDHSKQAYDGWFHFVRNYNIKSGSSSTSSSGDFSLSRKNTTIEMKEKNGNYIYGPFKFAASASVNSYSLVVKRNDTNKTEFPSDQVSICKSGGASKSLSKTSTSQQTFYIKIAKENCANGISSVKLTAKGKVSKTKKTSKTCWARYELMEIAQPVGYGALTMDSDVESKKEDKEDSIKWTTFTGSVTVVKEDSDDETVRLPNVTFSLSKDGYYKTFKTDENGEVKIQNLSTGTYTINEISNPNADYKAFAEGTVKITKGKWTTKVVLNPKVANGNLTIVKYGRIPSTGQTKMLSSVGFIVQTTAEPAEGTNGLGNITGKYVNVDGRGKAIYSDSPQILYTDEDGEIHISNLFVTSYSIREEVVLYNGRGEVNYGYGPVGCYYNGTGPVQNTFVYETGTKNIFTNDIVFGNLLIQKVAQDTKKNIPGIEFKIQSMKPGDNYIQIDDEVINYNVDVNNATVFKTDNNGIIKVDNLEEGDYKIIELGTAEKYSAVQEATIVHVKPGTNLSIYNDIDRVINNKTIKQSSYKEWYNVLIENVDQEIYNNIPDDLYSIVAKYLIEENKVLDTGNTSRVLANEIETQIAMWKRVRGEIQNLITKRDNYQNLLRQGNRNYEGLLNLLTKQIDEFQALKEKIKEYFVIYFAEKDKDIIGVIDKHVILNLPTDFTQAINASLTPQEKQQFSTAWDSYTTEISRNNYKLRELEEAKDQMRRITSYNNNLSDSMSEYKQKNLELMTLILKRENYRIALLQTSEDIRNLYNDLRGSSCNSLAQSLSTEFNRYIQSEQYLQNIYNQIHELDPEDGQYESKLERLEDQIDNYNTYDMRNQILRVQDRLNSLQVQITYATGINEQTKQAARTKIQNVRSAINEIIQSGNGSYDNGNYGSSNNGRHGISYQIRNKEDEIRQMGISSDYGESLQAKLSAFNELSALLGFRNGANLTRINQLLRQLGFSYTLSNWDLEFNAEQIKSQVDSIRSQIQRQYQEYQQCKSRIESLSRSIDTMKEKLFDLLKTYIDKYNQIKKNNVKSIQMAKRFVHDIVNHNSINIPTFFQKLVKELEGRGFYECESYYYNNILGKTSYYIYQYIENQTKMKLEVKKRDRDTKVESGINGAKFILYGSNEYGQIDTNKVIGTYTTATGVDRYGKTVDGVFITEYLKQGIYYLKETEVPYPYELPNPNNPIKVNLKYDEAKGDIDICTAVVTNVRTFINLSGMVWEDLTSDKSTDASKRDNLYNSAQDQTLEGIKVSLKDSAGREIQTKTTNKTGGYQFTNVRIDKLSEYYIEFEYNGMCYERAAVNIDTNSNKIEDIGAIMDTVGGEVITKQTNIHHILNTGLENGNKADEDGRTEKNRTNFNEAYSSIVYGASNKYPLYYETQTGSSKLLYRQDKNSEAFIWGYEANKASGKPISGVDSQYMIKANTKNAYQNKSSNNTGYLTDIMSIASIRSEGILEITSINLGIHKREEVDISTVKDLESVKVHINGEEHTYKYANRFDTNLYYDGNQNGYNMSPAVKFGKTSKYGTMSYTTALYASDIKYGENDNSVADKDKLEVKATYKIGFLNKSTLKAKINEIVDYFDQKYEIMEVGTAIEENGDIKQGYSLGKPNSQQVANTSYKKSKITTNLLIEPGQQNFIYIQLKVIPSHIIDIVGNDDKEVKLDNIVEISSYSIKDKDGNAYAAIDKNSQPENTQIERTETYEDDTDKAPGLKLVLQELRKITGKVFEDNAIADSNKEIMTRQYRQGNGIYEPEEKPLPNVEVRLIKKVGDTQEVAKVWDQKDKLVNEDGSIMRNANTWEKAIVKTDSNGEFSIEGFVPGDYQLVYIWGNETYKVQNYKSTIVEEKSYKAKETDLQWYKDEFKTKKGSEYEGVEWNSATNSEIRRSDAVDNQETRKNIDTQSSMMTNRNEKVIKESQGKIEVQDESGNITTQDLITKMDSYTPTFKVNVEYDTNTTNVKNDYELNPDGSIQMDGKFAKKKLDKMNHIKSIDFGIVERARQALALHKTVNSLKITLANGNILVNAKIGKDGKLIEPANSVVVLPKTNSSNAQIKIEVDNEILEGSELEIEYGLQAENISELDYLNEEFYKFGKGYEKPEEIVTLTAQEIIDYLEDDMDMEDGQERLGEIIKNKSDKYELLTKDESDADNVERKGLLENSNDMRRLLDNTDRILVIKNQVEAVAPIETEKYKSSAEVHLMMHKLLASNSTIDNLFTNKAELIKIKKSGGSTVVATSGNYIPGKVETYEHDNAEAPELTILNSTGKNLNYTPVIIIIISILGILSGGIILIKKYLKKLH